MLESFLKSTFRHILRNRWYSLINIFGLSIGFSAFIIILLFIQNERSYDTFHKDAQSIYRMEDKWKVGGERQHSAATNAYLVEDVIAKFPEAQSGVRIVKAIWSTIIHVEDKRFPEDKFCFADSTFFDFFSFKLKEGDAKTALNSPNTVVITESTAKKYFGNQKALGKMISYNGWSNLKVTGVVEDIPANSHIHFDLFFSIDFIMRSISDKDKADNIFYTFIKIPNRSSVLQLQLKVNQQLTSFRGYKEKLASKETSCEVYFQPLTNIHLNGCAEREIEPNGNALLVMILGFVSILLLIIAGVNYANFATAKSAKRAKEIGIRKALGSNRAKIFMLFMGESYFMCFVSLILALLITSIVLPGFNSIFGLNLKIAFFTNGMLASSLLLVFLVLGFLSGLYPALILSKLNPLKSIHLITGSVIQRERINLQGVLIVLQMAISVFFIIGALVVNHQLHYLQNKELGFDKSNLLVVPLKGSAVRNQNNLNTIKEELLKSGTIKKACVSYVVPGERFPFHSFKFPRLYANGSLQSKESDGSIWMRVMLGDAEMIGTFGLEIVAGKDFNQGQRSETCDGFIINEAAAKYLNLKNPIGELVEYNFNETRKGQIIGVVKDFNFASLHSSVEPLIIHVLDRYSFFLLMKVNDESSSTTAAVREVWRKFYPNIPIDYYYMTDKYNKLYKTEENMRQLALLFTMLAIILAIFGLFGMSFYAVEQRKKEIGIRKVLGASIVSILNLFSFKFILLVLLANIIAWIPVTLLLNHWLSGFPYHASIGSSAYIATLFITIFITLISVGFNVINAALANPVEVIKME